MTLSDTQSQILAKASQHEGRLAAAPPGLPSAARTAVFRSMLKNGLVEECAAPGEHAGLAWRQGDAGEPAALRITDAGCRAIGVEPEVSGNTPEELTTAGQEAPTTAPDATHAPEGVPPAEAAPGAPTAPDEGGPLDGNALPVQAIPVARLSLREASQAVLAVWDDESNRTDLIAALDPPMRRLRGLLTNAAKVATNTAPRKPREGTKQEAVL